MKHKSMSSERTLVPMLAMFILCVLRSYAAPVDPKPIKPPPPLTITQPLEMPELSTEELFKAILIHDTIAQASPPSSPPPGLMKPARPRTGFAAYKLPSFLDYPIFNPSRLVTFDATKQPVQLPKDAFELSKAVRSFAFNTFYIRLDQIQPGSSSIDEKVGLYAQIKSHTVAQATRMATKEALAAQGRVREWAGRELQKSVGREVKDEEVEKSLQRTWLWWQKGLQEGTGGAFIPWELLRAKILRRSSVS